MKYQVNAQMLNALFTDLTFYTRNGKNLVKRKSRVSPDRLKFSPEYAALRHHQQYLKLAASGGKLLRTAFAPLLKGVTDANCVGRLTGHLVKVIKSDTINIPEQKRIDLGNLDLMRGFEFNANCPLSQVLKAPFQVSMGAAKSQLNLELPALVTIKQMRAPRGSSHFSFVMGIAAIDFTSGTYQTNFAKTGPIPMVSNFSRTINLSCELDEPAHHLMFVVLGIQFSQQVRKDYKVIHEPEFDALRLVAVKRIV